MLSFFHKVRGIAISTCEYYLNKHKMLESLGSDYKIIKTSELDKINFEDDFNLRRKTDFLLQPNILKKSELANNILNLISK